MAHDKHQGDFFSPVHMMKAHAEDLKIIKDIILQLSRFMGIDTIFCAMQEVATILPQLPALNTVRVVDSCWGFFTLSHLSYVVVYFQRTDIRTNLAFLPDMQQPADLCSLPGTVRSPKQQCECQT